MVEIIRDSRKTGLPDSISKTFLRVSLIWFFWLCTAFYTGEGEPWERLSVGRGQKKSIVQLEKEAANETIQMYRFRRDDPVDFVNL
jgi:hypothetical protein